MRLLMGRIFRLVVCQRSDAPQEIALQIWPENDSVLFSQAAACCVAGHIARPRIIWFAKKSISALEVWLGGREHVLTKPEVVHGKFFESLPDHSAAIAFTCDEAVPWNDYAFINSDRFRFKGERVTQYWRMAANSWQRDLAASIQALSFYPGTEVAIIGGTVCERFGIEQSSMPGQTLIYGATLKTPQELGFKAARSSAAGGSGGKCSFPAIPWRRMKSSSRSAIRRCPTTLGWISSPKNGLLSWALVSVSSGISRKGKWLSVAACCNAWRYAVIIFASGGLVTEAAVGPGRS